MAKIDVTDEQLETLRSLYFPRRSSAERFTDAVLAAWAVGFPFVLGVVGWWILNGGRLPN